MATREQIHAKVAALARSGDLEIIPLKSVQEQLPVIPQATTVAVTCSAKFGIDRTLDYVERLAKAGHRVRPHIAARQVPSHSALEELVERLKGTGVPEMHVIGGDAEEAVGTYTCALDLLEDLSSMDHGLRLSVACYPEGHPHIPDDTLVDALRRKQPYAAYMINQLCFDPTALVRWLTSMRMAGITLPLRVGLAPPINPAKLLDISVRIGVGTSVKYLSKQHGFLRTLLRGKFYKPERLLAQLGDALVSPEMNIDGLHIFSFNQIPAAVEWQHRVGGAPR